MPSYRFYLLNAAGKIGRTAIVDCADDAKAMATAQGLLAERKFRAAVEVWHEEQFIGGATREDLEQAAASATPFAVRAEAPIRAMAKAVDLALRAARRAADALTGGR